MNIYLIGYRGCGKSTVAPLVAGLLDWQAVDSDHEVEMLVGKKISEIFAREGEAGFRQWEASVIEGLSRSSGQVVSLGGGAILDSLTRKRIGETGSTFWLKANAQTLWSRMAADPNSATMRPKLTAQGGLKEVEDVLAERTPIYESCADFTIEVADLAPDAVANRICEAIEPL